MVRGSPTPATISRLKTILTVVAASGGLTVLIGLGFYYYVNFYRTEYATSASGLPLVDAGAALGLIAFILQMVSGPRIRRALKSVSSPATPVGTGQTPVSGGTSFRTALPPMWLLVLAPILLLLAFALMIGGSMM